MIIDSHRHLTSIASRYRSQTTMMRRERLPVMYCAARRKISAPQFGRYNGWTATSPSRHSLLLNTVSNRSSVVDEPSARLSLCCSAYREVGEKPPRAPSPTKGCARSGSRRVRGVLLLDVCVSGTGLARVAVTSGVGWDGRSGIWNDALNRISCGAQVGSP